MKIILLVSSIFLTGCANMLHPNKEQLYYEAAKSISKDNTISQTACWNAIAEIAKGGDSGAKVGAVVLAERCKNETIKIDRPRNWFGF